MSCVAVSFDREKAMSLWQLMESEYRTFGYIAFGTFGYFLWFCGKSAWWVIADVAKLKPW